LNLVVNSDEIRNASDPLSGDYSVNIPSDVLTYSDVMPFLDVQVKTLYSLVEIEKQLLDIKIARIDEYFDYLKVEEASHIDFMKTLNSGNDDNNIKIVQYVDVDDINTDSKEDLESKLKNIYNHISSH
jgi:uncharacterized membrane protein